MPGDLPHRRERRWHLALPALVGALGLALSVQVANNTPLALAALTVAAMGSLTCVPQFYILAPTVLSGPAAASGLALANSVGSIAGFVSPYLLGWVKDTTFEPATACSSWLPLSSSARRSSSPTRPAPSIDSG